nr:reverse transcriptase domain-containing protein [Tanacetum cinerariifolium]
MPIELGTFDVIIRMDWLILHDAVIVCGKKELHVPLKKRTLVVKGDDCVSQLKVVSCIKVKKYVDRGSYLFVDQVVEMEPVDTRLEDVPVIYKFPDVFLEDLPRLPPPRQVEFEIELVPGAAPVARAPYWCGMQHYRNCPIKCDKCGKIGHKARDCWSKVVATGVNAQAIVTCYGCREKGHIKTNRPARINPGRSEARGQAYALRHGDQNLGPNVVT